MKILIAIEDVNFNGGAHVSTYALLAKLLELGVKVEILTLAKPNKTTEAKLKGVSVNVVQVPCGTIGHCLRGSLRRFGIRWYPNWTLGLAGKWYDYAASFDTVCCLGEPSIFRWFTASLPNKVRKVVMIHTDYSYWSKLDKGTRTESRFDGLWYQKMDAVAVVGRPNAERMKKCLPCIADKIVPFHNILKTIERPNVERVESEKIKIVTLSRLNWGPPKKTDAIIRVAARLKAEDVKFDWTVYGDGDREKLDVLVKELDVGDVFHMPGYSPDAQKELARADLSIMLSDYEGLSNGIYEAMMLGVPVFSTKVGGAEEQIEDGVNGWLVENDEDTIFEKLSAVLSNRDTIRSAREALKGYHYDNDKALREHLAILGIEG